MTICRVSDKFDNSISWQFINIRSKLKIIKKLKTAIFLTTLIFTFFLSAIIFSTLEESYAQSNVPPLNASKVTTDKVNGDYVGLPIWRLDEGETTIVAIKYSEFVSQERIDIIKNAITSEAVFEEVSPPNRGTKSITYYKGWQGALNNTSGDYTQFQIPKNLEILDSPNGESQILIQLLSEKNLRGHTGYTQLKVNGGQIVKSVVTIYEADSITDEKLVAIVRHEFGHALGLGHSSDPHNLMYWTISLSYPYISECDVGALKVLYNGEGTIPYNCE